MVSILFYSFLSSFHIYICGYIFHYFFINREFSLDKNFFELAIYGAFVLSFISLFLNFFLSLNKFINTLIFILPFIFFFIFFFNKNLIKKILEYSIYVSVFFLLTISYDGTYRPDAGLYHLPYISILNENKIIIGLSNIHFRFGHVSILQYLSAIYNNFFFNENGISVPSCIIFINIAGYIFFEVFNKKNDYKIKVLSLIFLIFIFFRVNRYSDFGNDAIANLLFFYLIIESLKNNSHFLKIKKTILISTFIFLNKITLLLGFLIPLFFIYKNFKLKNLLNRISIFSFIFLTIFFFKNILVSGCAIFPVEQSCFKNLFWYDKDSQRNSNAAIAKIENEAWTKGWFNQQNEIKDFKEFSKNFNWLETWVNSDLKKIGKKLSPFLIFIFILLLILKICEVREKPNKTKINKINNEYLIMLFFSIIGSLLWFLKFPVFRYGYGYLISSFAIAITINLTNYEFLKNQLRLKKIFTAIIILLFFGVIVKNSIRIYKGFVSNINPWPNIYSAGNVKIKQNHIPIVKNNKVIFYKSKDGECYYSRSPCTNYFNGNDFTLKDINLKEKNKYKIFYFK